MSWWWQHVINRLYLYQQDDSDDEGMCTKRIQPRKQHRTLERREGVECFFDLSCEEGEETASSEVWHVFLDIYFK